MSHTLDDTELVFRWTVEQFQTECDCPPSEALRLAQEGLGWHELAKLLADGCPHELAIRILT